MRDLLWAVTMAGMIGLVAGVWGCGMVAWTSKHGTYNLGCLAHGRQSSPLAAIGIGNTGGRYYARATSPTKLAEVEKLIRNASSKQAVASHEREQKFSQDQLDALLKAYGGHFFLDLEFQDGSSTSTTITFYEDCSEVAVLFPHPDYAWNFVDVRARDAVLQCTPADYELIVSLLADNLPPDARPSTDAHSTR